MTPQELGWLAGLLEGEGSFCFTWRRGGRKLELCIALATTDQDVAEHVARLMDANLKGPYDRGFKPVWAVRLNRRAAVEDLMRELYPLMGERRRARIAECLQAAELAGRPRVYKRR